MSGFDKREKGFETKFAHDEETKFKIVSRRNRLMGQWAAEQLGLAAAAVDGYVKEVIEADLEEAGDADILRKVLADFKAKGIDTTERALKQQLSLFAEAARQQLTGK